MIKAIIFDKDGVLLNLEDTWIDSAIAMTHFFAELSDGRHNKAAFQNIIGINEDTRQIDINGLFAGGSIIDQIEAIGKFDPEIGKKLTENKRVQGKLREVFLAAHETALNQGGSVSNGDVAGPISALKEAGYLLGVLTNDSEASAKKSCTDIGILDYFDMVVGFDSGFGAKPTPGGFLAICEHFAIDPVDAVMIGDTQADRNAALAAGAGAFIGISSIYPAIPKALMGCAHVLGDLGGLPDLMAQLATERASTRARQR